MHITKMHFAFLNAVRVKDDRPLAKVVMQVAQRHHAYMVRQVTERAIKEAQQRNALERS
jgi:hypothetical protein